MSMLLWCDVMWCVNVCMREYTHNSTAAQQRQSGIVAAAADDRTQACSDTHMSNVAAESRPLLISSKHATLYSPISTSASVTRRRSPPLMKMGVSAVSSSVGHSVRYSATPNPGMMHVRGHLTPRCVWSPMIVSEQLASPSRDITILARSLAMARRTYLCVCACVCV